MSGENIRLCVFVARATGISRRKAFEEIRAGRVQKDGKILREPSFLIPEKTKGVTWQGRVLRPPAFFYGIFHKPRGWVTTKDDRFASRTIFDILPPSWRRLQPCGRLDKDSEGLLVLSNDGEFIQRMTHPRHHHPKVYEVTVQGEVGTDVLRYWKKGIVLEGRRMAPVEGRILRRGRTITKLRLTLYEGRKRQIRRMAQAAGVRVLRLKRVAQGPFKLGSLPCGKARRISESEMARARQVLGLHKS